MPPHTTGGTIAPPQGVANSDRWSVAAQAAELAAMADDATGLIEVEFAGGMVAQEAGHVVSGLEVGVLGVALFASEGIVDFGVADDAIGHLGHGGRGDLLRLM